VALLIPPGFAQAAFQLVLAGDPEPMITTLGVNTSGVGGDFQNAANVLHERFAQRFMPSVTSQYTLQACFLYVGQDGGAPVVYESTGPDQAGGDNVAPLPQNSAWLVRKRTTLGGRRGRGRMYVPGIGEGTVDHLGVITTAARQGFQDNLNLFWQDLAGAAAAVPLPPVLLHRSEGIGLEPVPTPILQFILDLRIATQRRRMRP
jgi:hypothetical protein